MTRDEISWKEKLISIKKMGTSLPEAELRKTDEGELKGLKEGCSCQ